jgi:ribosomal RNA-processing protein 12
MIESNVALSSGNQDKIKKLPPSALEDPISSLAASDNVKFLRTQVESWLAVLFNVFGSVDRDHRGSVGDVISAWASIAGEEVCEI